MSILMATEIEIAATDQSVVLRSAPRQTFKESHDEKFSPAELKSRKPSVSDDYLNDGTDSGYATKSGTPESDYFSTGFALPASKLQIWPRIIKLKVFDEKAIPPLTWKRFNDLNELFSKPLYEHLTNSKVRYRALSIKLKVLGPEYSQSKPWIVVQCDKPIAKRVRQFFNVRWVRTEYHPPIPEASCPSFGVLVCERPPRPIAGKGSIDVFGEATCTGITPGTLPGCMMIRLSEEYGSRIATVGGLVKVSMPNNSSRICGLTAGHIISRASYEDSLDDHQEMEDEASDDLEPIELRNTDPAVFELELPYKDGAYGGSAFSSSSPSLQGPRTRPLATRNMAHWQKVGSIIRYSKNDPTGGQNLDWALINIDPLHFPVDIFRPGPNRGTVQTSTSSEPGFNDPMSMGPDRKVIIMSTMSGVKNGELTTSCSYLMLAPSKRLVKAYTLALSDGAVLQPGECGAWVADSENGRIYGYVTASDDTFGEAYVIPMEESFKQIKSQLGAKCVSFPTAEEVEHLVRTRDVLRLPAVGNTSELLSRENNMAAYWNMDVTPQPSAASPHSPQRRPRSSSTSPPSPSSHMMSQSSPRFGSFSSAPSTGPSPSQSPKPANRSGLSRTVQHSSLPVDGSSFDLSNEVPFPQLLSELTQSDAGSISNKARISSSASEVGPSFSVADTLKWKSNRKRDRNVPLPKLFPLEQLKERDHIFLIDNSISMTPYWDQVCKTFEAMSYLIKRADPSEMVMHCTDSGDHCRIRGTKKPLRMLQAQRQQLGGREFHDARHPIYKVLEDYHNTGAFSRKKVRPLNLYVFTTPFGRCNLSIEQAIDLDGYCRRVFKTVKPRLTIRFIYFGSLINPMNTLRDNTISEGYGSSITLDSKHSSGSVLKMLGGSADPPIVPAAGPGTKTGGPLSPSFSELPSMFLTPGGHSMTTPKTGVNPASESRSADNQTAAGLKQDPSYRPTAFWPWDDLADDEAWERAGPRYPPVVDRPSPPNQNFGQKLKRKFAIKPIRDDRDYYERRERDRKTEGLKRALNEGLRSMKLKADLNSQQNADWKFGSTDHNLNWRPGQATMMRHWGSDEDLVRDLGIGVAPELRAWQQPIPRLAPIAVPMETQKRKEDWQFPIKRIDTIDELKPEREVGNARTVAFDLAKRQQRKISFFDVGGLLDESRTQGFVELS